MEMVDIRLLGQNKMPGMGLLILLPKFGLALPESQDALLEEIRNRFYG